MSKNHINPLDLSARTLTYQHSSRENYMLFPFTLTPLTIVALAVRNLISLPYEHWAYLILSALSATLHYSHQSLTTSFLVARILFSLPYINYLSSLVLSRKLQFNLLVITESTKLAHPLGEKYFSPIHTGPTIGSLLAHSPSPKNFLLPFSTLLLLGEYHFTRCHSQKDHFPAPQSRKMVPERFLSNGREPLTRDPRGNFRRAPGPEGTSASAADY